MKAACRALLVFFISAALMASFAGAQKPADKGAAKYDLATETKVKGIIDEVKAEGGTTMFMIKNGAQVQEVFVAPTSFLTDMQCSFAKGDEVEITGSKVKTETADTVLAREIVKGQLTLTLRDKKGGPVWSGWKR